MARATATASGSMSDASTGTHQRRLLILLGLLAPQASPAPALDEFAGARQFYRYLTAGITDLMAGLLTDGAGSLDAQAFRQRQEDAAASLGFNASLDRLTGSLRVL